MAISLVLTLGAILYELKLNEFSSEGVREVRWMDPTASGSDVVVLEISVTVEHEVVPVVDWVPLRGIWGYAQRLRIVSWSPVLAAHAYVPG